MQESIQAFRLTCEKCKHVWISERIPERCARCKSRQWNEDSGLPLPVEKPKPYPKKPLLAAKAPLPIESARLLEAVKALQKYKNEHRYR